MAGAVLGYRDFASRCADRPKIPAVFASRRRDPASRRRRATTRCRVGVVGPDLSPDPVPGDNYYAGVRAIECETANNRLAAHSPPARLDVICRIICRIPNYQGN